MTRVLKSDDNNVVLFLDDKNILKNSYCQLNNSYDFSKKILNILKLIYHNKPVLI